MLKTMRKGSNSPIVKLSLFGFLLLAMAGLALMDVQGMFTTGITSNKIAKIDHEKISVTEFDRIVQTQLRNNQIKQNDAYRAGIPLQILQQEITSRLFKKATADAGLFISDEIAAQQIKEILSPAVKEGVTEKEALNRLLQNYQINESTLVSSIKEQIATERLLETITSGIRAPEQMITDQLKYRNEWRRGAYFTLSAAQIGAQKAPVESELKSYYDSTAQEFSVPEYRNLSALVLNKESLVGDMKLSDDQIKQYYDDNITEYQTSESRVISQALVNDEATAQKVKTDAEKFKNLQKAVDAAGKDKASYIKALSAAESELPAEIAKPVFTSAEGAILAPIKSALGWHVIYVEKIKPTTTKPFAEVRAAIEKELLADKIAEEVYQRANKIDEEIAGGKTLAEVAKENNVSIVKLDATDSSGMLANGKKLESKIPMLDKVIETGFNLKQGETSQLFETKDGAYIAVAADKVTASYQQPFDKVRAKVLALWTIEAETKALSEVSSKIMDRIKQGESFEKIAAEYKQPIRNTEMIKRGTKADTAKIPENLLGTLFSIEKTGHASVVSDNGAVTIVKLSERKAQISKEDEKKEAPAMLSVLNRSLQQDLLEQYRAYLTEKYDVSINEKLISEIYTPRDETDTGEE